jgi:hypothetical protein
VSDGWMLSNTPAISPVAGSTLATLNTAEPAGQGNKTAFSLRSMDSYCYKALLTYPGGIH